MTTDTSTDTPALDRAVILMQALEELLHGLPESSHATSMQVLAANVTTALASVQFGSETESGVAPPEEQRLSELAQRLREKGTDYGPADHVLRHIRKARDAIARGDGDEYDREADQAEATLNRPFGGGAV
jgi:hypothetical protein